MILWIAATAWAGLPETALPLDARDVALGGAEVAAGEPGLALTTNPATLEAATSPTIALGFGTGFGYERQGEALVAAPLGAWTLAASGRYGWGLSGVAAGPDGPDGTFSVRSSDVGLAAAFTPTPRLSVGAAARMSSLSVKTGDAATMRSPAVDVGVIARPPVPGLQVGVAGYHLGAACHADVGCQGDQPEVRAGASFALDDELLPKGAPRFLFAVQGGWSPGAPSVGGGLEVVPEPHVALRGGLSLDDAGYRPSFGAGLVAGPVAVDYAATLTSGLQHTVTVALVGKPSRERSLVALREERDRVREEERKKEIAAAEARARESTTEDLARDQIERIAARLDASGLDADGRLKAGQLLDAARDALGKGQRDDAWALGVAADLAISDELVRVEQDRTAAAEKDADEARRRAEQAEADAKALATSAGATSGGTTSGGTTPGGTSTSKGTAASKTSAGSGTGSGSGTGTGSGTGSGSGSGTGSGSGSGEAPRDPAKARDLEKLGLEAYRSGDFAGAAERWKQARDLDPTLPGIDGYIANAETKAKTLADLRKRK